MTTFNQREQAFENKFARDEHLQFVARMRRNRFMAIWASAIMGDTVEQARDYARKLIKTDLKNISDEDVVRALINYLGERCDEQTIRAKMQEMMAEAKEQVLSESDAG